MILIKNTQRDVKLDTKLIKKDAQAILDMLDYSDFDLGIWFTTNSRIQEYNRTYRHKDKPTDVLSFAYHHTLKAGETIVVHDDDDKNLGDLIIAPAYVQKDAKRLRTTLQKRIRRLLVHGICHLLGYDHIEEQDYKIMIKKEIYLLRKLQAYNKI